MRDPDHAEPVLDETHAAFLGGPVAINIASRDANLVPSLARAYGCRVSGDRRRVTVFVSVSRSEALLRDLGDGSPIAVVFTRPSTHQTIQLKGTHAAIVPLAPEDRATAHAYAETFIAEIQRLGYKDRFARALTSAAAGAAVGVEFTPVAAFEQTPGPAAGKRLGRKS